MRSAPVAVIFTCLCLFGVQELDKKFQQTAAYRNMKEILTKKNEQIKDIRKRLQRWDLSVTRCCCHKTDVLFKKTSQTRRYGPSSSCYCCLQGLKLISVVLLCYRLCFRYEPSEWVLGDVCPEGSTGTTNRPFHRCKTRETENSASARNCLIMLYPASSVHIGFSKECKQSGK